MAVRMSVSDKRAGEPGIERVEWSGQQGLVLFIETTYVKRVLSTGEINGYDDSDFTVTVWDDEANAPKTFTYASTRGWTYANSAIVDADEVTLAKFKVWKAKAAEEAREARRQHEAQIPSVGKSVVVVKGNKVPKGASGRVFWFGLDRFKTAHNHYSPNNDWYGFPRVELSRVGIELADGSKVFTAAENVKVVEKVSAE